MNRILITASATVLSQAALAVDLSGDWQFDSKVGGTPVTPTQGCVGPAGSCTAPSRRGAEWLGREAAMMLRRALLLAFLAVAFCGSHDLRAQGTGNRESFGYTIDRGIG